MRIQWICRAVLVFLLFSVLSPQLLAKEPTKETGTQFIVIWVGSISYVDGSPEAVEVIRAAAARVNAKVVAGTKLAVGADKIQLDQPLSSQEVQIFIETIFASGLVQFAAEDAPARALAAD